MSKEESKMTTREVEPGLIGMSRGDTTINAIVYGADGLFYFYPVTTTEANDLEDWMNGDGWYDDLRAILPDAPEYDLDMLFCGEEMVD